MKSSRKLFALLLVSMVGASLAMASPAYAATRHVYAGQSIQRAVNRANPGDTIIVHPGVYREYVVIRKNNINLVGSGANSSGTVLKAPAARPEFCPCGIAVIGDVNFQTGNVRSYVKGVTISGFYVKGYRAFGVVTFGAKDTTMRHNRTEDTGEYGLTSFESIRSKFLYNETSDAGEAGIYYGDSQPADGTIAGNESYRSNLGILIRNASVGRISDNDLHGNCSGIFFIAGAPGPVTDWYVNRNQSHNNNRFCAGEEGEQPPTSGNGIFLGGTTRVVVERNTVWNNQPSGNAFISGGIAVVKAIPGFAPRNNVVRYNVAYRNLPYDIFYDKTGSGNQFIGNQCNRSRPRRICG